jgi:hypothetical protein
MSKPKDAKFYTELVLSTILSLVAASLWIEWTRGFIHRYFEGQPSAVMGVALTITLLAIFCLQFVFNDVTTTDQSKDKQPQ